MDFESGLGRDPAGLARDPSYELFLIVLENASCRAEYCGALLVGGRSPSGLGRARFGGCAAHVSSGGVSNTGDGFAGCRLQDVERTTRGTTPLRAEYAALPRALDHQLGYRRVHPTS